MYAHGDCICVYSTIYILLSYCIPTYRAQKEPALSRMHWHGGKIENTSWVVSDIHQADSISQQALIAANKSAAADEV